MESTFPSMKPAYENWEDLFGNPLDLKPHRLCTGIFETQYKRIVTYTKRSPRTPLPTKIFKGGVYVYVITHPNHGSIAIDAGLDKSFQNRSYGSMKGLLTPLMKDTFHQKPTEYLPDLLNALGVTLKRICFTHLHFDHTAGLLDLPKDIALVWGVEEKDTQNKPFLYQHHLTGFSSPELIDWRKGIEIPPFKSVIDLWGDGSMIAIHTPGHSPGHFSFLLNTIPNPWLIVGDASHSQFGFDHQIAPGFSDDPTEALDSLNRLYAFYTAYPQIKTFMGHE
jgi:N-acyl homoserine lactone hydrolase